MSGAATFVYGKHPVRELLVHAPDRVERVVVADSAKSIEQIQTAASTAGISITTLSKREFAEAAPDAVHQSVFAEVRGVQPLNEKQLRALLAESGNGKTVVALDCVEDPQNLGAIARVAEALGVAALIVPKDRSASLSPGAWKASAGALALLPVAVVTNLRRALEGLKQDGYWICGTALGEDVPQLGRATIPEPTVLVLGQEHRGMRKAIRDMCDVVVQIPMSGRMQSLNVSQAASILLYELSKRSEGEGR